jgi:hypothetical protein
MGTSMTTGSKEDFNYPVNYINKELGFVTTYYLAQLRWYFKYFMTFSKRDHFKASWSGSGQKISG